MRVDAILLVFLAACSAHAAAAPAALPSEIGAWTATGETEVYEGDDLFLYIDGGAGIYHEYGFEQVTVRDYRRGADRIGVEAYRMKESAYGIFSFLRSASAEPVDLADAGSLGEYYVRFRAGRDLVVVTAQTGFPGTRKTVLEISRSLADRFGGGGIVPPLVLDLPEDRRVRDTEVHILGPLAMRRVSAVAAGLFPGFDEAAAGIYGDPGEEEIVILVRWGGPAEAASAMESALEKGTAEPGTRLERTGEDRFCLANRTGRMLCAERGGRRITITEGGTR